MPELSYSRGPHLALREETIFEARSQMARGLPAHEALVVRHQNARLTYRELKERVEETARGLVGLGLEPGERIGVWASSCVEWVLLFLACARTGMVQVNVNPAATCRSSSSASRRSVSGVSRRLPASEPRERAVSATAPVCTDERLPLPQGR